MENFINVNVSKTIVLKMATHREKQYHYVLLSVGVFLVLASLWILFDYQNAFTTVISFILSSIAGFLASTFISACLGVLLGIRFNPKLKAFTIDHKFTKEWFSKAFKVIAIALGVLLTLMITSSNQMDSLTNDFYNSFVELGVVQSSIIFAGIGLIVGGLLIYFTLDRLKSSQ